MHTGEQVCDLKDPTNSPEQLHSFLCTQFVYRLFVTAFASALAESTCPSDCSCLHLTSKLLWPLLTLAMLRLSSPVDILWFSFVPSRPPSSSIPNSEWLPGSTVLFFSLLSFLDFSFSPEKGVCVGWGVIVGLGTQNIFLQVTSVFREIPKFYIPLPPPSRSAYFQI